MSGLVLYTFVFAGFFEIVKWVLFCFCFWLLLFITDFGCSAANITLLFGSVLVSAITKIDF